MHGVEVCRSVGVGSEVGIGILDRIKSIDPTITPLKNPSLPESISHSERMTSYLSAGSRFIPKRREYDKKKVTIDEKISALHYEFAYGGAYQFYK